MKFLHWCLHILSNGWNRGVCHCDIDCQFSNRGFQIFRIRVHHRQLWVGVEVEFDLESDSDMLVPKLRHEKPGVQLGDCPEGVV